MRSAVWSALCLLCFAALSGAYGIGRQAGSKNVAAQWQAEIMNANFAAAKAQAAANAQALAAEAKARAAEEKAQAALADLEAENAELGQKTGGCGFDAAHIRLLNRAAAD